MNNCSLNCGIQRDSAYSPYCCINISKDADMENLSNNQELLQLVISSCILLTLIFDSGGYGEEKLDVSHSEGFISVKLLNSP